MSNLAIFGVMTYSMILLTAVSAILKVKEKKVFSFQWHKRFAIITLLMALAHGLVGLSRFF
jgi:hypothetical protein